MTHVAHPDSFLHFGCAVTEFVTAIEHDWPPSPIGLANLAPDQAAELTPQMRAAIGHSNVQHDILLDVFREVERRRLREYGLSGNAAAERYAVEHVGPITAAATLAAVPLRLPTPRELHVRFVVGLFVAIGGDVAATVKCLNRDIPRDRRVEGYTHSQVRNALDASLRPLLASRPPFGLDVGTFIELTTKAQAARSAGINGLWRELKQRGEKPTEVLLPLMKSGDILPMLREAEQRYGDRTRASQGWVRVAKHGVKTLRKRIEGRDAGAA